MIRPNWEEGRPKFRSGYGHSIAKDVHEGSSN